MILKRFLLAAATFCMGLTAIAQESSFEGELLYENTVTCSAGMRKLFPSLFKDGSYEMQFILKGKHRVIYDTYAGLVQHEDMEKDMGYCYSPLLKKGFKYVLSTEEARMDKKYKSKFTGSIKNTGEAKEIEGIKCQHYKGELSFKYDILGAEVVTKAVVDGWIWRDFPPMYIGSIKVQGMPLMLDMMHSMGMTLMGSQRQHQNIEVKAVKPRSVDDSELVIPKDIQFVISDDAESSMMKLQKEIAKYVKKNKLTDGGVKVNHGTAEGVSEGEDWD